MDKTQDNFVKLNFNEFFYSVFENASVLMSISTIENGTFIDANNYFLIALGYSRDELIGKTSRELSIFFDADQRDQLYNKVKKYGFVSKTQLWKKYQ